MTRLLLLLPLLVLAGSAAAQVELYDREDAFLAAAEPAIRIDFESIEAPDDQPYPDGYEESGVRITASDRYLRVRNEDAASNGFLYGADRERQSYVEIELPPGATAIGSDVSTFYTNRSGSVRITLSSGEVYEMEVGRWFPDGPISYFGVISSAPLEWVRYQPLENDDPRAFETDAVVLDDIAVAAGLLAICTEERAFCEAELSECQEDLAIADSDGDGEADASDACPETPPGSDVDAAGCSRAQFCASVPVQGRLGAVRCWLSDWRNDEPLGARDCTPWRRGTTGSCAAR